MPVYKGNMQVQTTVTQMMIMSDIQTRCLKTCLWATILFLFFAPSGAVGETENQTLAYVNVTIAPVSCPAEDTCNTAGAVIGSLTGGFVLGAIVTYLAGSCLSKRKHPLPPKDYDVRETSHFDVNRNNDGDVQYSVHGQVTPGQPGVKGHKKLERLVKPAYTTPGDIEIATAAVPLIQDVRAATGADALPTSTTIAVCTGTGKDNVYANVGADSLLSQPYEALDVIVEEAEYDNPRAGNYGRMSLESAAK